MKLKKMCGISLLLGAASLPAAGGECDLTIRYNNTPQDLNRILQCLYEKIRDNEAEIAHLKKRLGGGDSVQNPDAFNAGPFSLRVRGASRQGKLINLGIAVRNNTTEELLLALENSSRPVLIDDDTGVVLRFDGGNGIQYAKVGSTSRKRYIAILPNASANFGFQFENGQSRGRAFSLSTKLVYTISSALGRWMIGPLSG